MNDVGCLGLKQIGNLGMRFSRPYGGQAAGEHGPWRDLLERVVMPAELDYFVSMTLQLAGLSFHHGVLSAVFLVRIVDDQNLHLAFTAIPTRELFWSCRTMLANETSRRRTSSLKARLPSMSSEISTPPGRREGHATANSARMVS